MLTTLTAKNVLPHIKITFLAERSYHVAIACSTLAKSRLINPFTPNRTEGFEGSKTGAPFLMANSLLLNDALAEAIELAASESSKAKDPV